MNRYLNIIELLERFNSKYTLESDSERALRPIDIFDYKEKINKSKLLGNSISDIDHIFDDIIDMLKGSFNVSSVKSVLNMVPNPALETILADFLMKFYNVNAIMDSYGGKSILYEQMIASKFSKIFGWKNSLGISCAGGKVTLIYAITEALRRHSKNLENGYDNDLVIVTPEYAHYSIEHCCSLVGIGEKRCIRVKFQSKKDWSKQLILELNNQRKKEKRVACIISCGGSTIDFNFDDTLDVVNTANEFVSENKLEYFPYLHLDSVIGWIFFLFFNDLTWNKSIEISNKQDAKKIQSIVNKLHGIEHYDSFSMDFHKNGLCPYSSSFYVKNEKDKDLWCGNYYGQVKPYKYTIENSRSASGIASAWVSMKMMGVNGYQEYLLNLYKQKKIICDLMVDSRKIKVMNINSVGWEIVFTIKTIKNVSSEDYNNIISNFSSYNTSLVEKGEKFPLVGYIPNYKKNVNALLWYNMCIKSSKEDYLILLNDLLENFYRFTTAFPFSSKMKLFCNSDEPIK